jgi:hypothetical protein
LGIVLILVHMMYPNMSVFVNSRSSNAILVNKRRDETKYDELTFEGYQVLGTCALDRDRMGKHSLASRALSHA